MTLVAPFGLLAGALLAPLVLWYLLRSRRPPRLVASTLLLADEQQTASAAVPWQPFAADRTFWLVALALLLGALALARPAVAVPAAVSDHTILVIDASASMRAATTAGTSRVEEARTLARELIGRAGDGRVISIIQAGPQARVLGETLGGGEALAALDRLTTSATRPALDEALTLAGALIRPGEGTVVHVLTDGAPDADTLAVAPAGTIVDIVGTTAANIAIGAVQATPLGGGDARLLVDLASFADLSMSVRVVVLAAGREVAVRQVEVPPRGRTDVAIEISGVAGDVVEVVATAGGTGLAGDDDVVDVHPHDDRGWVVLPELTGMQVMAVGPPNVFLDAALQSLPDVTLVRRPAIPASLTDVDVLVVDRSDLPQRLPVPTLAIAPTSLPDGVTTTGRQERPTITSIAADHPLLADAALEDLAVAEMATLEAPSMQPVVAGPDGPLLLSGRLDGAAVVLLPFALADSTLPLQVAFPVLVANALQLLAGPVADAPLVAGVDRALPVTGQGSAVLIDPEGAGVAVDLSSPSATLDRTGIWTLRRDGAPDVVLAVNPDVGESDLTVTSAPVATTPSDDAAAEGTDDAAAAVVVGAEALSRPADPDPVATEGRIELSRWFLLAAIAVLAVELAASTPRTLVTSATPGVRLVTRVQRRRRQRRSV